MVAIAAIRKANTSLLSPSTSTSTTTSSPPRIYTALFFGATTGIGENSFRALSRLYSTRQGTGLRGYIIGRKKSAAEAIISECRQMCPNAEFGFVKVEDLTLLRDADRVCEEVKRVVGEGKGKGKGVDMLVFTQGLVDFGDRKDTTEGLDRSMALLYYSRIRITMNLLPLLLAAPEPAHIISVYAGGMEAKLFRNDLSLRKPGNYSFANCRSHCVYMKTFAFEHLAAQYPGKLSFVHTFPGIVVSPSYGSRTLPLWFRTTWALVGPFVKLFAAIPLEENGDRMIYLATSRFPARGLGKVAGDVVRGTDGSVGSGAYAVAANSEPAVRMVDLQKLRNDGFAEEAWQHTMSVFDTIAAGQKFED